MAKAWKDVIASPQYQALAPEQKAQAQEQYFNEVVAPQAGENAEQAKQAFYDAYPLPSMQTEQQEVGQSPDTIQQDKSLMQRAGEWLTGGQSVGQIAEQAVRGFVNIPFDVLQGGRVSLMPHLRVLMDQRFLMKYIDQLTGQRIRMRKLESQ